MEFNSFVYASEHLRVYSHNIMLYPHTFKILNCYALDDVCVRKLMLCSVILTTTKNGLKECSQTRSALKRI